MSSNTKIVAVVALVIIVLLIGINSTSLALPAGNLLAQSSRLGCCNRGSIRAEGEPRQTLGGCCSGNAATGESALSEEELRDIGLTFYRESEPTANLDQVEARVVDFGCHQEIHIYKGGVLILKVGYSNGQAYQIPFN